MDVVVPLRESETFKTFSVPSVPSAPCVNNFCFFMVDGDEANEMEVCTRFFPELVFWVTMGDVVVVVVGNDVVVVVGNVVVVTDTEADTATDDNTAVHWWHADST